AGADRVDHHVDLGVDRIGAPDHHEVRLRHLARIDAGDAAGTCGETGIGGRHANSGVEARVALHVAQTIDAVAHDETHGPRVVVRAQGLRAVHVPGAARSVGH